MEDNMSVKKEDIETICDFYKKLLTYQANSVETIIMQRAKNYCKIIAPFHVAWEITSNCNFQCIHCRAADNISNSGVYKTQLDELYSVVDDFKNNHIYSVGITGGEPFLFDYIFELLSKIRESNIKIILYTNASLIDYNIAQKLSKILSKEDVVHISLDGAIADDNDRQRGYGTFEKICSGLKYLSIYDNIYKRITLVPTIHNISNLPAIFRIADKYNVNEVSAVPLMTAGRAKKNKLTPSVEELLNAEIEMIQNSYKYKNIKYLGGVFGPICLFKHLSEYSEKELFLRESNSKRICDAGTRQLFIDSQGDVFPCNLFASCPEMKLGNIFKNKLENIWNSPLLEIFKNGITPNKKCETCKVWNICNGGCMALSYLSKKSLSNRDPRCL